MEIREDWINVTCDTQGEKINTRGVSAEKCEERGYLE